SRNNVDIAVATNKDQIFAQKIVSELFPYIKFLKVIGGCKELPKKPSPDIIYEIKGNREHSEIYMTGDSNVDIETAKNAGIKSIGCLWGFRTESELENAGADYIVSKPSEIKKIIV
ncbi:MAG: HAD family hydrolase, partial [Ruminococcus sp.]